MMPVASTLLVLAGLGMAATAPDGSPIDDRPGRVFFEQAEEKFNVGRFDEALADYQAAYEVEPLPAFLFNIGQCYRNLGNYERAQFFFRRYVALAPRSPNRAAADRLIAEMDELAAEQSNETNRAPSTGRLALAAPSPAATGAAGTAVVTPVVQQTRDAPASPPVYRRAWFWAGVAVVVAGVVVAGIVMARDDPEASLGAIDLRDAR
jgi:tetratricopeptide (TPR) repeat protein